MKCVVTGANGFLGSWLCKRLIEDGHTVTALVRPNSDLAELKDLKINYTHGDVTDIQSMRSAFQNQEAVFHLAGVVAYKKADRPLMDKVNVKGTKNVVAVCEELQPKRLLHLSSVVAVGASFEPNVLNETSTYDIHDLNLGYFETKRQAEEIVMHAVRSKKINAVCVNPATIYGPADAKKGSRKTQVKVAQGRFPFYTSGGVNVVSVLDVVDGILQAYHKGTNGERYILSSENLSIKKLFEIIADCAGVKAPKIHLPNFVLHSLGWVGDTFGLGISQENAYTASMYHWFDSSKAKKELDFSPSPSFKAIESSVRWMKDNGLLDL